MSLDQFDRDLLGRLQVNSRRTTEELGRDVGLSASAVQRRIKRLRGEGYIEREIAVVSPKAVGRPLTLFIDVYLERAEFAQAVGAELSRRPEVMQCYAVTGEADFVAVVTARTMEEFEAFAEGVLATLPGVRRYKATPVKRRMKATFEVPLD